MFIDIISGFFFHSVTGKKYGVALASSCNGRQMRCI